MKIIAINGFKRSGKGTVAAYINELLHEDVVYELGFADKVKRLGAEALGFDPTRGPREMIAEMDKLKLDGRRISLQRDVTPDQMAPAEYHYESGREFVQNLGRAARLLFGEDFWVDQVLPSPLNFDGNEWDLEMRETTDEWYPYVDVLLFTDLRHVNEAKRIIDHDGKIVRVERPGVESDGDVSEQLLPNDLVHYEIPNDGDLDDLRDATRQMLRDLGLLS